MAFQVGQVEVKGRYKVGVTRGESGDVVYESEWFDNLITDRGMDLYATGFSRRCWVGSGATAPSGSDQGLENPYSVWAGRHGSSSSTADLSDVQPYSYMRSTFRFEIGEVQGVVSEVGIGPASDDLFSRALLPIALMLDGELDRLYVIYELRQYIPTEHQFFDTVIDGVTRSCEAYPVGTDGAWWRCELGDPVWHIHGKLGWKGARFAAWLTDDTSIDLGFDAGSMQPYEPGSFQRVVTGTTCGPGYTGEVYKLRVGRGFANTWGFHDSNGGIWEILIDPPIAIEEHQRLVFDAGVTWARCAGDGSVLPNPDEPEEPEEPTEPSLALWLDAADAVTVVESGGAVSLWADKSGNGRDATQPTSGKQPNTSQQLAGKTTITFDGSDDELIGSGWPLDGSIDDATIVMVTRLNSVPSSAFRFFVGVSDKSPLTQVQIRSAPDGQANLGVWRDEGGDQDVYGVPEAEFFLLSGHNRDSDSSVIAINGSPTPSAGNESPGSGIDNLSDGEYSIASRGGGLYGPISVAEIIVIPASATPGNLQEAEGYLAHKWGLEANLPSDHPYKTTDPGVPDYFPVIDPSTWVETIDAEFWPTQRLVLGVRPAKGDFIPIETWEDASDTVLPSEDVIAAVNAKTAETGISAAYGAATAEGYMLTFSIAESVGFLDAEVAVAQYEETEVLGEPQVVFTPRRYRLYRQ